ncbi:cutinase-domain-containing protein [Xylaria telfairii]|nr:cutinase-domain-containing protein [Xylaria telfairii]
MKMKFALPLFLCLCHRVISAPSSRHHARQAWSVGWWSSELQQYGCRPIIFVFAKATYEPGNLGTTIGPALSDGLKIAFGVTNVATQGVDYYGLIGGNYYPGGAPPWAIFDSAAIVHRAIEALPAETRARIAGVVTFGDTQTLQDGGRIVGYPANQTLIICNYGDIICVGTMVPIFPVHWDYVKWVPTATLFLAQTVLAANAVDPWPNGSLVMDLSGVGELGPGMDGSRPVPTKLVAFPAPPAPTGWDAM